MCVECVKKLERRGEENGGGLRRGEESGGEWSRGEER